MTARLVDSRRLPGVNLMSNLPGAVMDVSFDDAEGDGLVAAWKRDARRALGAVGWGREEVLVRRFAGGASLMITAPFDALYPATEVNEWAWAAATGTATPLANSAARLRDLIAKESAPAHAALREAARGRDISFHADHKGVSVGSGVGVRFWPAAAPQRLDWTGVRDVPTVLVTGSNGKTTTARLLAAVVKAWGKVPGLSTTDNIVIGKEVVDEGDWSGPMGARAVLRDARVEVAILETARGGILRRGLAVDRADAAIVTNVAEDHFGEWGIGDLAGIAETKLVVGRVARRLVINAETPALVRREREERNKKRIRAALGMFALDPGHPVFRAHVDGGGTGAALMDGRLVFVYGGRRTPVVAADEVPVTLGGTASFNIANALGVILLATAIGIPGEVIARGLRNFKGTPGENPGRSHLFRFGECRVIVDFAHNPHGMRALVETARALPSARKIVILGQAGDRNDESIRGLARETWPWRPDVVILKEMERYLRGRKPGEATGIIKDEFLRLGAGERIFSHADSELGAVCEALTVAREGDLVLMPTHAERAAVLALMDRLVRADWRPGAPLPRLELSSTARKT